MGLRVSEKEALERGWINADEVREKSSQRTRSAGSSTTVCSIDGDDPQSMLWRALLARYPRAAAVRDLCWEFAGAVPGRRFRVDILWHSAGLAIEVDGYQFHGRIKAGFHRDREKDRLLMKAGWRVIRYSARDIIKDLSSVVEEIMELAKKTPQSN